MLAACEEAFEDADAVIKAAAPADFYVVNASEHKMKKRDGDIHIELAENPDILKTLGEKGRKQDSRRFCRGDAQSGRICKRKNREEKSRYDRGQ